VSLLPLLLGLTLFFVPHVFTTRRQPRLEAIGRYGEGTYKGLYTLLSVAGLALIVWGFGYYRSQGYIQVWDPPRWLGHLNLLLMLLSLILLASAYAPTGWIKAKAKHPMLAAVKLWAFGHLLANGDLGSMLLFGAFLAYGVFDRIAVKKRERIEGAKVMPAPSAKGDAIAVVAGLAAYVAIAFWLHPLLFGVGAMPGR
jgi:uncharacterized membrane protein